MFGTKNKRKKTESYTRFLRSTQFDKNGIKQFKQNAKLRKFEAGCCRVLSANT